MSVRQRLTPASSSSMARTLSLRDTATATLATNATFRRIGKHDAFGNGSTLQRLYTIVQCTRALMPKRTSATFRACVGSHCLFTTRPWLHLRRPDQAAQIVVRRALIVLEGAHEFEGVLEAVRHIHA